ncbi:secretory calcium-binding phosphoprotein 5 [Symphorus nematophorus]
MKLAILCLCLASTASAAPSFFHYLPHYAGSRQQVPPTQIYPHRFPGAAGANQPFPSHGLIKYSIPQPPGRQSLEVYYPFDFSQQTIPAFDANPPPSQDPLQPLQQDQPAQTSQMPAKA